MTWGALRRVALIFCGTTLLACAPQVELRKSTLSGTVAAKENDCPIDWYESADQISQAYGNLGEVYAYDENYLTFKCSEPVMRERVREEACKAGADGAVILSRSKPKHFSRCTRIRAELVKYGDFEAAELLPVGRRWSSSSGLPKGLRRNR